MNGELWKLKEAQKQPRPTRAVALSGIMGLLLACGVTYSLLARAKPAATAVAPVFARGKPRVLRVFEGKTTFAIDPIQTIDLRRPCSGFLTVNLSFPKGVTLSAFLVTAKKREKEALETFAHVEGFNAKTVSGTNQQSGELSPGEYTLVLLDENKSRSVVSVKAHLSDLK